MGGAIDNFKVPHKKNSCETAKIRYHSYQNVPESNEKAPYANQHGAFTF